MDKLILLICSMVLLSCGSHSNKISTETIGEIVKAPESQGPSFDADSAYAYIARQVSFGYRIPNLPSHKACGDYLAAELKRFGAEVYEQETILKAYDGTPLETRNIIGSFQPEKSKRILLFAHWDTRPYSDQDPNPTNHKKPLDGADDGASGVGVLLEIARQLGQQAPEVGVDIAFFDAEDYGVPDFSRENYGNTSETWCMGSRFWGKNPHKTGYKADFGILLDMVGAKDAVFYKEYISMRYAARYVDQVWETARHLGFGKYFIKGQGGGITDDHEAIIQTTGIPCIDIINYDPNSDNGFRAHWHTQNDTMDNIDKNVLEAVGKTVLQTVHSYR